MAAAAASVQALGVASILPRMVLGDRLGLHLDLLG